MREYFVKAKWDHEAKVWYVAETDIPGLHVEGETFEAFVQSVREAAPDLLDGDKPQREIPVRLMADVLETVTV